MELDRRSGARLSLLALRMPVIAVRMRLMPYLALLVAFPIVLTIIDRPWTFLTPTGQIDPYVYTGYFLHLREYLNSFYPAYYGSRLPWLLLGNAAYHFLSPDGANLLLRLILMYGAVFSIFAIVHSLWKNPAAALVSAVLLGSHPYFLRAINWDYVDGPGLVAMLAGLAFIALAAESKRPWPLLVAAGVALEVAISTNITQAAFLPAVAIWFVLVTWRSRKHRLDRSLAWIACGGLASFVVFGLINSHLNGQFNYLQPQIDAARAITGDDARVPYSKWVNHAMWLVVPGIATLVSALVVVYAVLSSIRRRTFSWPPQFDTTAALSMVVIAGIFVWLEISRAAVLQLFYYATYLLPFSFVALGAVIAKSFSRLKDAKTQLALALLISFVLLVPFVSPDMRSILNCPRDCQLDGRATEIAILAIVLLGAASALRSVPLAVAGVLTVGVLAMSTAPKTVLFPANQDVMHDRFLLVYDGEAAAQQFNQDNQLLFWYDIADPLGGIFHGVSSIHLWAYRLFSPHFPRMLGSDGGNAKISVGQRIAIFSSKPEGLELARQAMAPTNFTLDLLSEQKIARGRDSFGLWIVAVRPSDAEVLPLALTKLVPESGHVTNAGDGAVTIETEAKTWHRAASLILPDAQAPGAATSGYIHLTVSVRKGPVGFAVLDRDNIIAGDVKKLDPTRGTVELYLMIPDLAAAHQLLIETWDRPISGVATVYKAELGIIGRPSLP